MVGVGVGVEGWAAAAAEGARLRVVAVRPSYRA